MNKIIISLIMIIISIAIIISCNKPDVFGTPITEQTSTKIDNIIANPDSFNNKLVKVEGQIINECPGGHWFYLKGDKETIYVTLSGFILPQKVGRIAIIEGNVISQNDKPAILGKGVEIK